MPTTALNVSQAKRSAVLRQVWLSEPDCAWAARRCASALLGPQQDGALLGMCLHFEGAVGAGKTTFIRYLLRALGVQGRIRSPSYSLMEILALPNFPHIAVYHFDFYRFQTPEEFIAGGFDEALAGADASAHLRLVEWPSYAAPYIASADVVLHLSPAPDMTTHPDERHVRIEGISERGQLLMQTWFGLGS